MGRIKFKIRWKRFFISLAIISYAYSVYNLYIGISKYFSFISQESDQIRRKQIQDVMKNAWNSYRENAWGYDFLNPQTRHGENWYGLGYTIIDSLDTLILMGMNDEFDEALEWINNSFQYWLPFTGEVSFFETVIRSLGGLLTAYEQTHNKILLEMAEQIGNRLLPDFNTPSGLPRVLINLMTGLQNDHPWANGSSLLADAGSCQIEFLALSYHTGKSIYYEKSMYARRKLLRFGPIPPTQIFYKSLWPSITQYSFDAFGDSYFEYLLKLKLYAPYNLTDEDRPLEFRHAIEEALNRLAFTSWETGHEYLTTSINDEFTHGISHLSFFLPGTLFLAAQQDCMYNKYFFCNQKRRCKLKNPTIERNRENINLYTKSHQNNHRQKLIKSKNKSGYIFNNDSNSESHFMDHLYEYDFDCDFDFDCDCDCHCDCDNKSDCKCCGKSKYYELYLSLANSLLDTAIYLYKIQPTKIGGESARFTTKKPGVYWSDDTYKLRPELVESLFYSWRTTHNIKSKMVAWEIFESIRKYCQTDAGYTTVHQTSTPIVIYDDLQDSFFLSETLKYLYLIFSDDDVFSLDDYVFTTQAHPLKKLLYKKSS